MKGKNKKQSSRLKSYKNLWSLNIDEVIATGILRAKTSKDIEVFMPLNAQMKDVDLILINKKSNRTTTIQVKGSRAFEGNDKQIERWKYGSYGWIDIPINTIKNSITDYFLFLIYVIDQSKENKDGRWHIKPHTVILTKKELEKKVVRYKKTRNQGSKKIYSFHMWINPKTKKAFDFAHLKDPQKGEEYYSEFLDKEGFTKLNKDLK